MEAPTGSYSMVCLQAHSHMHLNIKQSKSRRHEDSHPYEVHPDAPRTPTAATALDGPSGAAQITDSSEVPPSPPRGADSEERKSKMRDSAADRADKHKSTGEHVESDEAEASRKA